MIIRDHRDAAAEAVESSARRAEPCVGCGMPKGSGLGPHFLGCPIDTAERAKAAADRSAFIDAFADDGNPTEAAS